MSARGLLFLHWWIPLSNAYVIKLTVAHTLHAQQTHPRADFTMRFCTRMRPDFSILGIAIVGESVHFSRPITEAFSSICLPIVFFSPCGLHGVKTALYVATALKLVVKYSGLNKILLCFVAMEQLGGKERRMLSCWTTKYC